MLKAQENILIVSLLIMFCAAFFLISQIYNKPQIPALEAGMVTVSRNMAIGATVDSASCRIESVKSCGIDPDNAKKEIDAAVIMGAGFLRFNVTGEILDDKQELQKLDSVVAYAREQKMKINLAFWGRSKWLNLIFPLGAYGGGGKAKWEDFQKKYLEDAGSYAQKYHPEYFVILPECPYIVGNQVDSQKTAEEWLAFAKQAALSIRQNSHDSKIILEGLASSGDPVREAEMEFIGEVIQNSDPIINVISMRAENMDDLENGVRNLARMREKYHWQGFVWMGDMALRKIVVASDDDKSQKQKEFFLYALYLANANNFEGFAIGSMRDCYDVNDGILKENYFAKPAYDSIKQTMGHRK